MKKLLIFLITLLIVAAGVVFYCHNRKLLESHAAYSIDSQSSYQQVISVPQAYTPVTQEATITTLPLEAIRSMAADTVLLDSVLDESLISSLFYSSEIDDAIKARISGISYPEGAKIPLSDLRYLRVLHRGFDGLTHIGEMIVHKSIADDVLEILQELYLNDYPIERMVLIDEYNGDDEASMSDNNSSAFNYRTVTGDTTLSNHAYGMAIDINPLYNPYVTVYNGTTIISPAAGSTYADRTNDFAGKMDSNDLCVQLFKAHGFSWGGDWDSPKDYQHFEAYVPQN